MNRRADEQAVRVCAPAKVNLILRVLDRRPDGYHNLWSLMHTVGVEDDLQFQLTAEPVATFTVRLACDDPTLPTDGRNLVRRAAELVLAQAAAQGCPPRAVDIRLTKRIPMGGGLGGGSSDAAATILGLNRLLGLGWSASEMAKLGESVGSDVPFFFFAPCARVRGRGEDVAPLTLAGARWVVLVNPGFPIETRWAYQCLAESRREVRPLAPALVKLMGRETLSWNEVVPLMENDFEGALAPIHPALAAIKTELLLAGAEGALLSGSGATVFGIFRDEATAMRAKDLVGRSEGRRAFAAPAGTGPLTCR
ncbi:MAG: 4-(cytidine 5'-diphospho)-2-C-methyl-D-erythritol kinase [Nitrospirota bacterium]|nr:4-(cytidine 5'-diphospho)-2-C-methyl-D-erythritol kinase [Nitrospirota bacterium]